MTNKLTNVLVALVLGGAFAAGTLSSCDDDDDNPQTTGAAGTIGTGTGGAGGTTVTATFNMTLTGAQEVPANSSTGTGSVTVTLNRTTGAVTVTGNFQGLSSNATAAHIHGPAAIGENGPVLVPLTIPQATSGSITGNGTMTTVQMSDMIGGMTYVNIHSEDLPDGELRAQIVP